MSLVDDFLRQAGAGQSPPQSAPAQSLTQKFVAQATAQAPVAPQQTSFLGELGRQAGLTGRALVTGVTALPAMAGDALNGGINMLTGGVNSLAGTNIPKLKMPSQSIQDMEDKVFPQPKNSTERVVQSATAAGFGLAPTYAVGKSLVNAASPAAQAVGRALTAVPGNQLVAAASGGASAQGAHEAGLGPGWQIAAGIGGGVLGSLGAAAAGGAASRMRNAMVTPEARPEAAAPAVQEVLGNTALPPSAERAQTTAQRTAALLNSAPKADPAAAARVADAKQLGMSLTLGQSTRDPGLFAQEQNWRGMPAGDRLLSKLHTQNQQLGAALENAAGSGTEAYPAGKSLIESLSSIDDSMRKQISDAYKAAEQSSGAKLDVPLQGVAQDYANALKNFGDKVPSGVRNNFEDLGLQSGMQKKIFGIDSAENLLKVINANRSNDPATNAALAQLSQSVKNAILSADDQGGVFAAPRQMAAQRFALRDAVPALADAADGVIAPEDFTKKYLMAGDVDHVKGLADLLAAQDPKALDIARGQVGNEIQRSAFGMNMAGDKGFSPERYAKSLMNFGGTEKLNALYGPDITDDLYTIGRVGSYINSEPSFSPVNRSNTGSALLNMAENIPVVGKAINALGKRQMIARSLLGDLNDTATPTPEQGGLADALMGTSLRPQNVPQNQK